MIGTRAKLLQAAAGIVREDGVAAASARVIAGRANVNQALVFYHFGTVSELIEAASNQAIDDATERYREQFDGVMTLSDLLELGRELHERERAAGNVAMMAQLMSGAIGDPVLARAARYAMANWTALIEGVITRVLSASPLGDVANTGGLARAISASFIGLELYEGVDPEGAAQAFLALENLGALVEVVGELGPAGRRALRAKLKHKGLTPAPISRGGVPSTGARPR